MKKLFIALLLPSAFCISSFCTKAPLPQNQSRSSEVYRYNDHYTDDLEGVQFFNECTGEVMTLSGTTHIFFEGIYNAHKIKEKAHINLAGLKATGESGREYRLTGTNNSWSNVSFSKGITTLKGVQQERWITRGGGNNFTMTSAYTIVMDAYGNYTVKRERFESECH